MAPANNIFHTSISQHQQSSMRTTRSKQIKQPNGSSKLRLKYSPKQQSINNPANSYHPAAESRAANDDSDTTRCYIKDSTNELGSARSNGVQQLVPVRQVTTLGDQLSGSSTVETTIMSSNKFTDRQSINANWLNTIDHLIITLRSNDQLACLKQQATNKLKQSSHSNRLPLISHIIIFILSLYQITTVAHISCQRFVESSNNSRRQQQHEQQHTTTQLGGFASSRHVYPPTLAATRVHGQDSLKWPRANEALNQLVSYDLLLPADEPQSASDNSSSSSTKVALVGQNQLKELRRQVLSGLADTTNSMMMNTGGEREVTLGSACFSAQQCSGSIERSHCRLDNFTCACLPYHVEYNSTTCLPASLLGFGCLIDAQCQRKVQNSFCSRSTGTCVCPTNFVAYRKDKCLSASKIDDYCLTDGQCQLADRHSFCQWKIPNVYGVCKCPPNYKLITPGTNETTTTTRCAPRIGDNCLDDHDCLLATRNSQCRELPSAAAQVRTPTYRTEWRSSGASSLKCHCAAGYVESANRLHCVSLDATQMEHLSTDNNNNNNKSATTDHHRQPSTTTTTTTTAAFTWPTESTSPMDLSKHHYELVIPAKTTTTTTKHSGGSRENQTTTAFMQLVAKSQQPTTTTTTTTSMPTSGHQAANITATATTKTTPVNNKQHTIGQVKPTLASSLGKSCSTSGECKARDPHSDCINGRCECSRPSARCSSNSTGCHKDTFQCRSGQCISWYFVCDQFKNCDDGSDEDNCHPMGASYDLACPPEAFQCLDGGACLTRSKLCNGRAECADGSDELYCAGSSRLSFPANPPNQVGPAPVAPSHRQCHPKAFTCNNGQCLPGHVFCNAVQDCVDGSDEPEHLCDRVLTWPHIDRTTNEDSDIVDSAANSTADKRPLFTRLGQQQQQHPKHPEDSPLVKLDRTSINKMLAALHLSARTPESRGRRQHHHAQARRPETLGFISRQQALRYKRRSAGDQQTPAESGQLQQHPIECPRWAFTCKNGKCRSSAILCSGVDGCGDNSDEDSCQVCKCDPI